MTNMTLALPDNLHHIMRKHKDIKWSEVARKALWEKAKRLELLDQLSINSEMSEQDALEIGKKINEAIAKHHKSN